MEKLLVEEGIIAHQIINLKHCSYVVAKADKGPGHMEANQNPFWHILLVHMYLNT